MFVEKSQYVVHAERATALLRKSVTIHWWEVAGKIAPVDAMEIDVRLMMEAALEIEAALRVAKRNEPNSRWP